MSATHDTPRCDRMEDVAVYALGALPAGEAADVEAHVAGCAACREELARLQELVGGFAAWPTDVVRPSSSLSARLAQRIAEETGGEPVVPPPSGWREPAWEQVAPGISCKILAHDDEHDRVTMLVRLEPGASYPPHTHAGVEELHLLDGELWIDDRLLYAGDYNYGEPGHSDQRVYSETGCTCVLITSPSDVLK